MIGTRSLDVLAEGIVSVWSQQRDLGSLGLWSSPRGWQQSLHPDPLSYLRSSICLQL